MTSSTLQMISKLHLCVFVFFICVLVGCSSKESALTIETTPSEASVLLDGKSQSDTPCTIIIPFDSQEHYIFISKNGYQKVRKIFRDNNYPTLLNITLTPNIKQ